MSKAPVESKPSAQRGDERRADFFRAIAVCGFLVVAVLLVFGQTLSHGFLNWDDNSFVTEEPHVSGGLSWSGIAWAFTSGPLGEWYPLAMLSHMLDCQIFGLNPAGHHLTNLLLHAASAVTLFLVLWRMTEALWPSAMVAALFAFHPLHVESVVWVAERRDVLSGLFFMLTLGAYVEYVRHPRSVGRYLAAVGFFTLGLMAKPMLVTLPPLLLLLDFWPLGRFRQTEQGTAPPVSQPAPFPWRVVVDKLPFLALAVASASVTMLTHSARPEPLAVPERLANAAISYVAYLGQLFVPVGLSAFYPHPEAGWPVWQVGAAVALLLAITAAAVLGCRSYPYFFVGWLWYVGMLVPVLGLTSLGAHARADRYTYLSQIGLYIVLVWGAMRLGASWPARRWVFGIGSALMLAALLACTWRQTGFWQDDRTLWEHALACDPKNVAAHRNLGVALEQKDDRGAEAQFRQALEMGTNERNIYNNVRAAAETGLGNIAARKRDNAGAVAHYEQALKWDSSYAPAHLNLGGLLTLEGKLDEAIVQLQRCIELSPHDMAPVSYMALALSEQGKIDEAIEYYRKALTGGLDLAVLHIRLAILLAERNAVDEAILHFRRAIELDPDGALPYHQIAQLLRGQGKISEAARYDELGKMASRRYVESQNLRGIELAQQGNLDAAIAQFEIAVTVFPDDAQAHCNLAGALALQHRMDEAIAHYRRALAIDPNLAPARQGLEKLLNR